LERITLTDCSSGHWCNNPDSIFLTESPFRQHINDRGLSRQNISLWKSVDSIFLTSSSHDNMFLTGIFSDNIFLTGSSPNSIFLANRKQLPEYDLFRQLKTVLTGHLKTMYSIFIGKGGGPLSFNPF
jgi:hypothetical protein